MPPRCPSEHGADNGHCDKECRPTNNESSWRRGKGRCTPRRTENADAIRWSRRRDRSRGARRCGGKCEQRQHKTRQHERDEKESESASIHDLTVRLGPVNRLRTVASRSDYFHKPTGGTRPKCARMRPASRVAANRPARAAQHLGGRLDAATQPSGIFCNAVDLAGRVTSMR